MSVISNVKVYGLEDSIKRAKYPMSTDRNKIQLAKNTECLWKK